MSINLNFNNTGGPSFYEAAPLEEIRGQLLSRLPSVLQYLLPNGKVSSHVFRVGNIEGAKGASLKVELQGSKLGFWQDFATNEGGDIFDLWAAVKGLDIKNNFSKVIEDISNWLGVNASNHVPIYSFDSPANKNYNNDNLGVPTSKWDYTNKDGKSIATVFRYDPKGKSKQFIPYNAINKKYKAPTPRPLYNLPGIASSKRIILVEGEKCAQALIDIGICATTAMGGANADINKIDWQPLKGKDIIIWPDNDEVGKGYAQSAHRLLQQMEIASVKIIDIPADKTDKWDAADAILEGIDVAEFIEQAEFIDIANTIINKASNDNNYIERIYDTDLIDLPAPMEWIIPDWLPKGEVGAIYGDGGLGKSTLVQQLMTALATGKEWLGFKREPIKVYGVLCEDKKNQFHLRQYRINQRLGVNQSEIRGNMVLIPRKGKDNILMRFDRNDQAKLTEFFDSLLIDIKKFQPQLVILDTLADLFGGNEIIRAQARQFVQSCCGKIAEETGATILICAHPSEAGLSKKSGTGGSTAWHNSLRFRWFIDKPEGIDFTPDMRTLELKKSNYSPGGGKFILKLERDGIFTVVEDLKVLSAAEKHFNKLDDLRDQKSNYILSLIIDEASRGVVYTMRSFSGKFQNTGIPNLGSKRAIQDKLEDLTLKGYIKFFQNTEEYHLPMLPKGNYGYMCTTNMRLKVKDKGNIVIKPTHYRCQLSGGVSEINVN